jgi:hypothetical protein
MPGSGERGRDADAFKPVMAGSLARAATFETRELSRSSTNLRSAVLPSGAEHPFYLLPIP